AAVVLAIVAALALDRVARRRPVAAALIAELPGAAGIHPDAAAVVAPGPPLDAGRDRTLVDEPRSVEPPADRAVVLLVVAALARDALREGGRRKGEQSEKPCHHREIS